MPQRKPHPHRGANHFVNVQVRLFAAARQAAGQESVTVQLPDEATVGDLRGQLESQFPQLSVLLRQAMFAIDAEYSADAKKIPPHSEVACIPPVSGG